MTRSRFIGLPVALALAVGGLHAAAPAQPPSPPAGWQAEVAALLDRRADAVERGDLQAFLDGMRGAPKRFLDARRTWFQRLRALPLGSYELELDTTEFDDLAGAVPGKYSGEFHIVQVKERIGFRGFDRSPSNEDLYLTVRRLAAGWTIVADTDVEHLFLLSMRNIWDFGPVRAASRNGMLVLVHPAQRNVAAALLTASEKARTTARRRWPYRWRDPIIVMVPSTVAELERVLQTQFDLSAFVAFAASSLDRRTGWRLTGDRVFLHWPNFARYGSGFQQTILAHEFSHLATRATTGPFVPAFMDEGTAQYYGEAAASAAQPETRKRVRAGTFTGKLPEDWLFTTGPDADIFLAYELSNSFVAFLGRRFDRNAGARVYRALAAIKPVSPGTWRYHLGRAFAGTFKESFDRLERTWAAGLRKELR